MVEVLDARGLKCPLPVLKARRALKALPEGARLEVLADDPAAPADFRAFSRTAGYSLEESAIDGGGWRFLLGKPA
jgi:tRNA 2-thiouridine synthesizing protein A